MAFDDNDDVESHIHSSANIVVFGYGSLVFRPSFSYVAKRLSYITQYRRRFSQGSPDHRGTPENPGVVVTLQSCQMEADEKCWGIAYEISALDKSKVLEYLDEREKVHVKHTLPHINFPVFDVSLHRRVSHDFLSCCMMSTVCLLGGVWFTVQIRPTRISWEISASTTLLSALAKLKVRIYLTGCFPFPN